MQLEKAVEKKPNARISIEVTVDKASVDSTRESVIREIEKTAKIPGFRKGRIPRNIILTRFSDTIKSETISSVLSKSLTEILGESEYQPISEPSITEMGDLVNDENFTFKAECDILPEVELVDYRGVSSEKYTYDVKKKTVDRELEALRERFATLKPVEGKAGEGNYLTVEYFEYKEDGNPDKKQDNTILLDKGNELTPQLVGLSAGDEKDIELDRKTDEKDDAGRTVKLHFTVKEVKEKELPELNDDFAMDISDAKTLDELKKKIKEDLEEAAAQASDSKTKSELMQKLIDRCKYEIPETMVQHEIDRIMADVAYSYRIDLDQLKQDEQKWSEYRNNLRPRALGNLKYELTLNEISKKEEIAVGDEEIEAEINRYAESRKQAPDKIRKQMEESGSMDSLRYRLLLGKALDFVYAEGKFDKENHLEYGAEEKE